MKKILEGDLSRVSLPDLFNVLYASRRDGVLSIESDLAETKIFVEDGRPVWGHSTKPEFRLGAVLQRQGKVEPQRLRAALHKHDTSSLRLGHALLQTGAIDEEDLLAALKVQASGVIFDAFSWTAGSFAFFEGVPVPLKSVRVDLDFHSLIIEGVRRAELLNGEPARTPDGALRVESLVNPDSLKRSVSLTTDEWQVLFLVDGRRTVDDVCRLAGYADEREPAAILQRLQAARFVRFAPPFEEDEEPEPAIAAARDSTPRPTQGFVPAAMLRDARVSVAPGPAARDASDSDDRRHAVRPQAVSYAERVRKLMVSRLILMGSTGPEASFPLNRDSHAIGRHRNNDIVITDPKVSGFHARVDRTAEGFTVVDLKSRNGTWVNDERQDSASLTDGDVVKVGSARLQYRVDYESAS